MASSDAEQGTALLFEASRQLESFGVKLYATQPVVEWAEATPPQQEVAGELVRSSLAMFQGREVKFWADGARRVAQSHLCRRSDD